MLVKERRGYFAAIRIWETPGVSSMDEVLTTFALQPWSSSGLSLPSVPDTPRPVCVLGSRVAWMQPIAVGEAEVGL